MKAVKAKDLCDTGSEDAGRSERSQKKEAGTARLSKKQGHQGEEDG